MKMSSGRKSGCQSADSPSQYDLSNLAERILATVGVGIYILQKGKFAYVSELFQKITGYHKRDLIGVNSIDFIFPDDREMVRKNAIQCLKNESCEPYEYRFIKKNKDRIWVMETMTSIAWRGERAALGSFMDITKHKQAEERLHREEKLFKTLADQSADIIAIINREGVILYENPAVTKLLGFLPEERIGHLAFQNVHPEDVPLVQGEYERLFGADQPSVAKAEVRVRHKNGEWRIFEAVASNMVNNRVVESIIINLRDITERKKSEEDLRLSEEKYRAILEGMQEGYFEVDLAGHLTFFNDPLCELIGYSREETQGLSYKMFTKGETAHKVFQAFNKVYTTGQPTREIDWLITRKDGEERYIETSVTLRKDSAGNAIGFKGVIRDITERKRMHQQLNYLATHDALTGLPNRMLFMDRLGMAIAQCKRNKNKLAVMMLDLDHFKDVNDQMGHLVGDRLLKEIGSRLAGILRHNDTVARLGGDEFVILLSGLDRSEYAAGVAKVILKSFRKPFVFEDQEIVSNASIGIALFPDDGGDEESLLRKSDMAMYAVKTCGRNHYKFFSDVA